MDDLVVFFFFNRTSSLHFVYCRMHGYFVFKLIVAFCSKLWCVNHQRDVHDDRPTEIRKNAPSINIGGLLESFIDDFVQTTKKKRTRTIRSPPPPLLSVSVCV